jgi:formylglycine-generating enzyme required for sulfatase activity
LRQHEREVVARASEKRVALVIGNAVYRYADTLRNPVNDAKAISAALTRLGFAYAAPHFNLDFNGLRRALQEFGMEADGADMAVIYFAGHGVEVNGHNFLIPVDAKLERSLDVDFETASLDQALNAVDGARQLRLIILDACRINPFRARMMRSGGTRTIGQGLRSIEPCGNVLVAYAAKHGTFALDGKKSNSPFAEALCKHIEKPGLEIRHLFGEVRDDVLELTGNEQEPHLYGSLGRQMIYLKGPEEFANPPPAPPGSLSEPASFGERENGGRLTIPWKQVVAAVFVFGIAASVIYFFLIEKDAPSEADVSAIAADQQPVQETRQPPPEPVRNEAVEGDGKVLVTYSTADQTNEIKRIKPGSGESFQDCWKTLKNKRVCGPEMVVVPAGEFMMGSPDKEKDRETDEDPRHEVTITQPFAAGKFEVTFAEWDQCVAEGGCLYKPDDSWGRGNQPVINISWDDIIKEYLPWLRTVTGKDYRLLSEAEWEYAARAGTTGRFSFAGNKTELCYYGNHADRGTTSYSWKNTSCSDGVGEQAAKVGSYKPNDWGLYDIHGNVWEWVQDCYADSYKDAPGDGKAAKETIGCLRVLRGGSWNSGPRNLRSAYRVSNDPGDRANNDGFRVARALNPSF